MSELSRSSGPKGAFILLIKVPGQEIVDLPIFAGFYALEVQKNNVTNPIRQEGFLLCQTLTSTVRPEVWFDFLSCNCALGGGCSRCCCYL